MIIATANAMRPKSSAAAKPMKRRPCWPSAAAGLRSALSRNEPNTLPTPMAAAPTPMAARPAPMTCAELRSILKTPFSNSVKVDCVVEIEGRQQREDVGLDGAHQKLQGGHEDDEEHAEGAHAPAQRTAVEAGNDKASEHFHQDVARNHGDEKPQAETKRANHEGNELDRCDEERHRERRSVRHKQREELEAVAG